MLITAKLVNFCVLWRPL